MLRTNNFPNATHRRGHVELLRRLRMGLHGAGFSMFLLLSLIASRTTALAQCSGPANPVVAENCLPGNPSSEWDIASNSADGDPTLQGFPTDISVNAGQTIAFKINTNSTNYSLNIYRMGYYGGLGARKIATVTPSANLPQTQPACLTDAPTHLVDCGNWSVSATWTVPANAASGIYFAHLIRADTGGDSHIVFIVRNDSSHSDILFQTADETWQAYNSYGGNSLYGGPDIFDLPIRASKVSYNRPFLTRGFGAEAVTWLFGAEYPMVRWLESNGYDVSYITGVDAARNGSLIANHKAYLSVGHDEYWSGPHRANVQAALAAGVNMAFFSGNEVFWKTRWENSIDGTNTPYRTLVCYKETLIGTSSGGVTDPNDPPTWTGTWRDPRFSPPADGGHPENALTGTLFMVNGPDTDNPGNLSMLVPAADGKMRFWRNTAVASQAPGATYTLPAGTLGYEWDADVDNGSRPPGAFGVTTANFTLTNDLLLDFGATYGAGNATHHAMLYRSPSGALVFGAGSVQWSWGLDSTHDNPFFSPNSAPDQNMQQATVNLFADMGAQPATIQPGLNLAVQSTDTIPPVSAITFPPPNSVVMSGGPLTFSGTATDFGGGVVGGVEISLDGGATWHPTSGRENWTYIWTPANLGVIHLMTRAVDDSGNLEVPGPGNTVTVAAHDCPCTIWNSGGTPAEPDGGDGSTITLGVKFRTDYDGLITGLLFYKAATNTGSHVGTIWTSTGIPLATATFTNETASGWQQVNFNPPVQVTANTSYVASYFAPVGHYSATLGYFNSAGADNPPVHLFSNAVTGGDGVYSYGSVFPTSSFLGTNYWVDVVFFPSESMPGAPASLSVSQTNLSLAVTQPQIDSVTKTVNIYNQGTDPLAWSASTNAPWIVLSATSGTTPTLLAVSANASGLAAGNYSGTITVTASGVNGSPQTILVNLTVTDLVSVANFNDGTLQGWAFSPFGSPLGWSVVNQAVQYNGGGHTQLYAGNSAWTDYTVQVDIKLATGVDYPGGFRGRLNPTSGAGYAVWLYPSEGVINLYSNIAWNIDAGFTLLGQAHVAFDQNVHTYQLSFSGKQIQVFLDGQLIITATDATYANGLVAFDVSTQVVTFDNVVISAPSVLTSSLAPAPNSLTFAGAFQGANPAAQTVQLPGTGSGSLVWTAVSNASWLTVTPSLGFTVDTLQAAVNISQLAPGTYNGAITLTSLGATDSPESIPVTLTVALPPPVISLTPSTLSFVAITGQPNPAPQSLGVGNSASTASFSWNATTDSPWLNAAPASGTTPANLNVSVNPSGLATGAYTGNVIVSAAGVGNSPLSAPVSLIVATCPCNVWPPSATPVVPDSGDNRGVELGVKFTSDVNGYVTGIRFYKSALNTGTHIGNLWTSTGIQLGTATFTAETDSGWQQVIFSTPVPITANTTYIASYYAPSGHYPADASFFSTAGVDAPPLHVIANSNVGGPNGVFSYGSASLFPTSSFSAANYWVDVAFDPGAGPGLAPTVTSVSPIAGGTNVPVTSQISATFSESMNPATITTATFQLTDPSANVVPATITYSAPTLTATLTPNQALAPSTTYTATLGASAGITDAGGDPLPAGGTSWSFTTVPAGVSACPCSIWAPSVIPGSIDSGDGSSVEVGVKFRADQDGYITGLRFYKAAANTGTHIGNLWTTAGVLLATATFTAESASGWQQVNFSNPVPITANTTYIASYFAPGGHYSNDGGYFANAGVNSPPLHALQNNVDGQNAVFTYGETSSFPASSFNSANYWVDVVMIPAIIDLSPNSLAFNQSLGTTSAAQVITLSNSGTALLNVAGIAITGANSGDFAQTTTCGATVAPGANCTISVTFTPSQTGPESATVVVTDDGLGSPQTVNLTGTAGAPGANAAPTSLNFSSVAMGTSSTAQSITLSNPGGAPLNLTSIAITGTNSGDFAQTNTCGTSVPAGGSCSINATFTPTATGARSAVVTISDNVTGSPQTVGLTGAGVVPAAGVAPASLTFANTLVGTSTAAQSITLSNTGGAPLNLTSIAITGTNSGDFAQTNTCGTSVPAGGNCSIGATFTPTAAGARSAVVTITDNATGSPQTASLTGTGVAPSASLAPASLTFSNTLVGTSTVAQSITLSNTGGAPLNLTSIAITGTNSGDFAQTNTCGTGVAVGANCSISVTFKPSATGARSAVLTITDNATGSPQTAGLTGTGVAPAAGLAPASLTFANTLVGTTAAAQTITLSNTGGATLNLSSIAITGTNSGDFTQTNTCGTSVAVGGNCSINVSFKPSATGARSAVVAITDNAAGSPQTAGLTGTGVAPAVSLAPASLTFGNQQTNTTSSAQTIQLTNTGTATLSLTRIAITGTNLGDFAQTNTCGTSLTAGLNCSINVTFRPTATGARSATVTITDNATPSPQTAALTGTGGVPTATISPSSVNFGNQIVGTTSGVQNITVTNNGNATLNLTSIAVTGANSGDFAQTNTCAAGVVAGAHCTVSVTFKPTATGTRTAAISFTDNAPGSPQTDNLNGSGVAPTAVPSPTSLTFGNQNTGTTSAAQNITLSNTGNATLTLTSIAIAGTNGGDFVQTNSCGTTLGTGSRCTISVSFKPTAGGTRTAAVTITDNALNSPQSVALTGTGLAPVATLAPASLTFASQLVGTTSAAQTITLTNTGTGALTFTSIAIAGTNSGDFAQTNTCGTSLAVGARCSINVTFKPTTAGTSSASVSLTDNAPGSPQIAALTGTGLAPIATLSPTSMAFGVVPLGTTSSGSTITLTNTGTATLNITSITITGANTGDFSQTNTCGASLTAGNACPITVKFSPKATGARSASVSITDNAGGSPQSVSLSGTGTTASTSPSALNFGSGTVGHASAAQPVTLKNVGTGFMFINGISISGTNRTDFSETNTCSFFLGPNSSCSINVKFTPTATGARSASLTITDSDPTSPQAIPLSGTGQ